MESQARLKDLKDRADLLVMSYLANCKKSQQDDLRRELLLVANGEMSVSDSQREILPDLEALRPFHWELEFPEVFLDPPQPPLKRGEKILQVPLHKGDLGGSGFDAICGNPPFMGGGKISGAMGIAYRDFIVDQIAKQKGSADFVAYFFLRVMDLIKENGCFGLVSTNTISQGDTREIGLDQVDTKGKIYRAVSSRPWSGTAALEVAYVWAKKGKWNGKFNLDSKEVSGITPYLTSQSSVSGNPYRLVSNSNKSFFGSKVYGQGFVLTEEEANTLVAKNSKNKDVLFPYLNGEDLNSKYDQSPSRWVINFKDWALSAEYDSPKNPKGAPYASDYPDCLEIVERLVKPEREKLNQSIATQKRRTQFWWQYGSSAPALYEAIVSYQKVLVISESTKYCAFSFCPTNFVFSHMTKVFTIDDFATFSILSSDVHNFWVWDKCSTLGGSTLRYSPTDCFETFPFPTLTPETEKELETIGEKYYNHRQQIMQTTQLGLTKTYNRFHDPNDTTADIQQLRELHIQMDYAVMKAYGWLDLVMGDGELVMGNGELVMGNGELVMGNGELVMGDGELVMGNGELVMGDGELVMGDGELVMGDGELVMGNGTITNPQSPITNHQSPITNHQSAITNPLNHNFHQTKQGLRFTISETARRDILDRLLALNHARYAEEVKAGVGKEKGKRKKEKFVDKRQTVLDV